MMFTDVYRYPSIGVGAVNAVTRRHPALASRMPPVLLAFLYHTYSGGGYPIRLEGRTWKIDTTLQHIELQVIDPYRAQLRAWARTSGPAFEAPRVDRTVACNQEGEQRCSRE